MINYKLFKGLNVETYGICSVVMQDSVWSVFLRGVGSVFPCSTVCLSRMTWHRTETGHCYVSSPAAMTLLFTSPF